MYVRRGTKLAYELQRTPHWRIFENQPRRYFGEYRISQALEGVLAQDALPYSGVFTPQTVTLQLSRSGLARNELSGSPRLRAKPPRPSWPPGPCSIPGRLLPARKPAT